MTKLAIGLMSLVFAFACGGDAQSWEEPEVTPWEGGDSFAERGSDVDELGDLGTVEQAYSGAVTNNTQWGARTASSRDACDRTSTGQTCSFLNTKTITYCADAFTGLSAQTDAMIDTVTTALDGQVNWTWVPAPVEVLQDRCLTSQYNVLFSKAVLGAGTASNDIKDYVQVDFVTTTGLTETGVPAPVGNFQKHAGCNILIDEARLLAKGTSTAADNRLLAHAIGNGYLVCAGLGRSSDATTLNRATRHAMDGGLSATGTSSAQQCKMNGYTATNNGQFSLPGNCGAD